MPLRENTRAASGAIPTTGALAGIGRDLPGAQSGAVAKKELTPEQLLALARKLGEEVGKALVSTETESAGLFRTRPMWSGYSIKSVENDVQRKQRWLDSVMKEGSDASVLDMTDILAKASVNRVDVTIELIAPTPGYEHQFEIRVGQFNGKIYFEEGLSESGNILTGQGRKAATEAAQRMGVERIAQIFSLHTEDGQQVFDSRFAGGKWSATLDGAKRDVSGARHTVSLLGSNLKKQEEEVERTRAIVDKYLSAVEDAGRRLADMRAAQKRSSMSEWNIALTIAVGDAQEAGREAGFNGTLMKEREWERDRTKARLEVQEKELAEAERKLAKVKAEQKERADELRAKWKESRRAT